MRLSSPARILTVLLTLQLPLTEPASADTLIMQDQLVFGKLVSIDSAHVIFAPACGPARAYAKGEVKRVERNGSCTPRPVRPYSAGGEVCADAPLALYEVALRSPDQKILAADVGLSAGKLHLRSPDGLVSTHGPQGRLVSISRGLFCRNSVPPFPPLSGFCTEDVEFAVNFGPEQVFANRILTRGLSFYLADDAGRAISPQDPRSLVVREAFGNAVTIWMGSLQDLGPGFPGGAGRAVAEMISHSPGGYSLLTPPQVVRVACPDTASFVVRWLSRDPERMTIGGHVKAARAQVEGRTIWINGATYACWKASLLPSLVFPPEHPGDPTCYNLTTVLTHEVGHALGLTGHLDRAGQHSIMDSSLWPDITWPSAADATALASVLDSPIEGAPAGRLDADGLGVEMPIPEWDKRGMARAKKRSYRRR